MANKNKDSLDKNIKDYTNYFKEDLDAVSIELAKSEEYSKIIDNEIKKLTENSLGINKGGQHYLIEHITNAVQLQTQRQSLRKDRFAIKKAIMDYAAKFADEESGNNDAELITKINELLEKDKNQRTNENKKPISSTELDDEIDRQLEENGD